MKFRKQGLTADQLRKFPGFSHLSESEAEEMTKQIKDLVRTVFEFQIKNQDNDNNFKRAA